jgi:dsRNA-specific ribonuclease
VYNFDLVVVGIDHLNVCLFQIMFGGEKVGEGVGRTKKEAKYNAAESALLCLASMVQVIFHV